MAKAKPGDITATRAFVVESTEGPFVHVGEGETFTPVSDEHAASLERIGISQRKGEPVGPKID